MRVERDPKCGPRCECRARNSTTWSRTMTTTPASRCTLRKPSATASSSTSRSVVPPPPPQPTAQHVFFPRSASSLLLLCRCVLVWFLLGAAASITLLGGSWLIPRLPSFQTCNLCIYCFLLYLPRIVPWCFFLSSVSNSYFLYYSSPAPTPTPTP